jgi:hypothetical protein
MRLIFFVIVQLTAMISSGQKDLELGDVIADTAFNCSDSLHRKFNDRMFDVPDICDSKNNLEIRLKGFSRPGGTRELIIFSNKDGKWDAKKYTTGGGVLGPKLTVISFTLPEWNDVSVEKVCTYILDHLIENHVFLLPDQSELKHEQTILDGSLFILSFKAGKLFRGYSYNNPDSYLEQHPSSNEYVYIKEIIKTLREIF